MNRMLMIVLACLLPLCRTALAEEKAMSSGRMEAWGTVEKLVVEFSETRENPFRRIPQRFEGTIYLDRGRGISIHYTEPTEMHLFYAEGKIQRQRGESDWEPLDIPDAYADMVTGLFRIFYWDPVWIEEHWNLTTETSPESWVLSMRPKENSSLDNAFRRVEISGKPESDEPASIRLFRSDRKDVKIQIQSSRRPESLSVEEVRSHFPPDA